ncbi:Hypothetical predicted protein [Paramuricea clavata]|uniref:Uncharacterized protein n=1 Tax=Paramuricea clavata TaxID=317549 RepID=A0A6S7IZ28_PARCT|nr:Hypothetical predicted protein [Paramuricea clavata]
MADHKALYDNYIIHIQRILVKRIPSFKCLVECAPKYIKHKHSEEMNQKSKKMQMGMIFESEVSNDGIVKVLQHVQQYLPTVGKDEKVKIAEQEIVGERAVNAVKSMANG